MDNGSISEKVKYKLNIDKKGNLPSQHRESIVKNTLLFSYVYGDLILK